MKFKQFIKEEYAGLYKESEVLVNPSITQIKKLLKDTSRGRIVVNFETKKIFIWNADKGVHFDVIYNFPNYFDNNAYTYKNYLGNVFLKDNVLVHSSDSYKKSPNVKKYLEKVEDEWTKYYFGERLSKQLLNAYKLEKKYILYDTSAFKDTYIINKSVYDLVEGRKL
jgi:hypothetical protein